jgi:hypothetical protein
MVAWKFSSSGGSENLSGGKTFDGSIFFFWLHRYGTLLSLSSVFGKHNIKIPYNRQ